MHTVLRSRALVRSRAVSLVLGLSFASTGVAEAQSRADSRSRSERPAASDTTFALARTALVDITVRTGVVVVRGSNRTDGELRTNSDRYQMRATGVGVTLSPRDVSSRSRTRDGDEPRIELLVPRGVRLVISAGSADVDVRDIDGDVEVRTNSGDIGLARLGGRAIVESLAGDLVIDEGVGDVRVTAASGDVSVRGLRGAADIHTTTGDVSLTDVRTSRVVIETISGDADIGGTLAADARVQVSTHSGDVMLHVGGASRGVLEFETFNGELTTTGPITMVGPLATTTKRNARNGQRFEFGGGGGVVLSISTFNGDLRFDRATR